MIPEMNAKKIAQLFKSLTERALVVANLYDSIARKELYDHKKNVAPLLYSYLVQAYGINPYSQRQAKYEKLEVVDTDSPLNTFSCSYEYNDACHCHPEYQDWTLTLPLSWLDIPQSNIEPFIKEYLAAKTEEGKAEWKNLQKHKRKRKRKGKG